MTDDNKKDWCASCNLCPYYDESVDACNADDVCYLDGYMQGQKLTQQLEYKRGVSDLYRGIINSKLDFNEVQAREIKNIADNLIGEINTCNKPKDVYCRLGWECEDCRWFKKGD